MTDQKQSQFTAISTIPDGKYLAPFGSGTNERISKEDLFAQIKDELNIFIYPTIELLQAADLVADSDFPVYVRVEETEYRLYKITSLAAGVNDIELDNGLTATRQDEYSETGFVIGPATSTNNAIAVFDGTTGTQLKDGPVPTTTGTNLLTVTNPGAITFPRVNTDNTVTMRNAAALKTDLSLGNIDNTSDANKPISTATQTALDLKVTGPASATDSVVALFDGITGKLIKAGTSMADYLAAFLITLYNIFPRTVSTFADLATTLATVGQIVTIASHTSGGLGAGDFEAYAAAHSATDGGTHINSATAGVRFRRINYEYLTPEMFGLIGDGVTNDNVAIQANAALTKKIQISNESVNTIDIQNHADSLYIGDGEFVADPYRKFVLGDRYRSDALNTADFIATKHAKVSCSVSKPTIVLVGNSLSTYGANTTSRGDVFAEVFKTAINQQFPRGVNFLNYSIAGTGWNDLFTDYSASGLPWFTTAGTWMSKIEAQNPTMVVFFFGMNESASISFTGVKNAIDAVEAFTVPECDILVVNQYPPTPTSVNALPDPKATMEGRDAACGFMRSYAKYRDVGLLDVHRKYCMALDGFDPTSTISLEPISITGVQIGVNYNYSRDMQCSDWVAWPQWNDSATGWTIVCKTGTSATDQVNIARSGSNLAITPYSQGQAWLGTVLVPYTFADAVGLHFAIEKKGDILSIYKVNSPFFGSQGEPIWWTKLISNGGIYNATVDSIGFQLTACEIGISQYVKNMPSIKYSEMWGAEDGSTSYGGSGWNHPSHYMAAHVYREVVQSTIFYQHVDLYGTVDVAAGTGNVQIFFDVAELSQSYLVFVTTADGDIDMSKRVQFRDFTNFRVYFDAPPTPVTCKIQWLLKRMY